MRCKSCDSPLNKVELKAVLHTNEDGSVVYDDWCSSCKGLYGSEEALDLLDTHWYQFEDLTEVSGEKQFTISTRIHTIM